MSQNQKKLVYNEVKELSFLDELIEWNKDKTFAYWLIVICSWLSIGLAFYHLFVAVYGTPEGRSFRSVHLSIMMILAIFIYPSFRTNIKEPIFLNLSYNNVFIFFISKLFCIAEPTNPKPIIEIFIISVIYV